eukprot:SAG11_NODE_1403_length_5007_cov_3.825591_2_plen_67_part_00
MQRAEHARQAISVVGEQHVLVGVGRGGLVEVAARCSSFEPLDRRRPQLVRRGTPERRLPELHHSPQ